MLLLGCAAPGGAGETAAALPPVPEADATPPRSPAELEASLQVALDRLLRLHGLDVFTAYGESLLLADDTCPAWPAGGQWSGDCTTGAGTTFAGYGTQLTYQGLPLDDGYYSGQGVEGDFRIEGAERLVGSGLAYTLGGTTSTGEHAWAWIEGTFSWTGSPAGTWVAEGLAPHLRVDAWREGDTRRVSAEGSMAWPDLAVRYVLDTTEGACFDGTLEVREADGSWYTATFGCDPCGTVVHRGEALGSVCVDPSPLYAWDQRPW